MNRRRQCRVAFKLRRDPAINRLGRSETMVRNEERSDHISITDDGCILISDESCTYVRSLSKLTITSRHVTSRTHNLRK